MFEKSDIDFLFEKLNDLQRKQNAVINDLNDLQREFERFGTWIRQSLNSPVYTLKNAKIRKMIRECIQKGMNYTLAIDTVSDLTGEDHQRIEIICSQEKYEKTLLKRYSRQYLVRHLLKHGLPIREIAKISEYNEVYIYQLKRKLKEPLTLYPDEKFAGKVIKKSKY